MEFDTLTLSSNKLYFYGMEVEEVNQTGNNSRAI
jgi:hypothetical protein